MDEETKSGYVAGVISLMVSIIFFIVSLNFGWDLSGQILAVFGMLDAGSIWKPKTVGPIASQILENIARNVEEEINPS